MADEAVVSNEQDQEEAGFADGFNTAMGVETPPAAEPEKVEPPEAQAAPETEAVPEKQAEETETVTFTKTELANLISKFEEVEKHRTSLDKAHGRLGALQDTIDKLRASQFTGGQVDLTDEDVKELEEYPDFKGNIKTILSRVLSKVKVALPPEPPPPAPVFDPAALEQKFEQRLTEVQTIADQKAEKKILGVLRPGWNEVVEGDDFKGWLAKQDTEYQQKVRTTWDAHEVFGAIQKFEKDSAPAAPVKPKTPPNKSRLEAAVTPKGATAPDPSALSEEDAFVTGFKSARG